MSISFESQSLKINILKFIGKGEKEELTSEDLDAVTSLSLDFISDYSDDFRINELLLLKNLRELNFKNFLIEDNELDVINKLSSLEELSFEFCSFSKVTIVLENNNLKILTINTCDNFYPDIISTNGLESLFIKDIDNRKEVFDIKAFGNMPKIQELFINNYVVKNLTMLNYSAPMLKELNVDGSVVFESDFKNLNHDIKASHEDECLL